MVLRPNRLKKKARRERRLARGFGAVHRFRNVMVGLTRSERDSGLIRYAAMLSRLDTVVTVRFVHILPEAAPAAVAPDHVSARAEIERLVAQAFLNVPESVQARCEVVRGPRVDRLLALAAEQEVDLLLVGHRPDHPPGGGSLVRRLAMKAPCSVWIVPDGFPPRLKKILVPVDFSESSADAMVVATSMARLAGDAKCLPLHVYVNEAVLTFEEFEPIARGEEEAAYRRFIAPIDCSGVETSPLFVEGWNVARTIHQVAMEQEIDLKIMSTRGRSRSAAILLGSVTEGVIIEARTPVLVVKHFGSRLGLLQLLLDRTFRQKHPEHFV
jgi:nucleotide-binding universal stress UspA family protein